MPSPRTTRAAIELRDLRKSFPGTTDPVRAVDGLDLTVAPGEIVAFLGPNGAGKSTTIDLLLGLATPDSGTVTVFGEAPEDAVQAGRVAAEMQSAGCCPTSPSAKPSVWSPPCTPGRGRWRKSSSGQGSPISPTASSESARAASSSGCGSRWHCCPTRT